MGSYAHNGMDKRKELIDTLYSRRAIKVFQEDKKISDEDFEFILEVGRISPSSFGFEPWKFLVVQSDEMRSKIHDLSWGAKRQLESASHFMILLARKSQDMAPDSNFLRYISRDIYRLPAKVEQTKFDHYKNFMENEFDLTDDRKVFDWSSRQVYIALANMMNAAIQIGIDSCPIEGFEKENVEKLLEVEGLIDRNQFGVSVMAAFGYKKEDSHYPKARQPMHSVVEWI